MTQRINYAALGPAARIVPVVLVAGIPVVLTPCGVHPTTVVCTTGTLDTAWWPGTGSLTETLPDASTFDPVKEWLDPGQEWTISTKADLAKGDCSQDALRIDLVDVDNEVTAYLSARDSRLRTGWPLLATVAAGDLVVSLQNSLDMATTGIACIGRETVTFDGIVGNQLQNVTRGKYGSRDRTHAFDVKAPLICYTGLPRSWHGRRVAVFDAVLSGDGLTLTDPTLVYLGVVGKGIWLPEDGHRWQVPVDSVVETLKAEIPYRSVQLEGVQHFGADDSRALLSSPCAVEWYKIVGATEFAYRMGLSGVDDPAKPWNRRGYHADWPGFAADLQLAINNVLGAHSPDYLQVGYTASNKLSFSAMVPLAVGGLTLKVWAGWMAQAPQQTTGSPGSSLIAGFEVGPLPEVHVPLAGRLRLSTTDFARVPPTLSYAGVGSRAAWCLVAEAGGGTVVSEIISRDAGNDEVTIRHVSSTDGAGRAPVATKRQAARLALHLATSRWDHGVQTVALGLDDVFGQDLYADSVDWSQVSRELDRSSGGVLPRARRWLVSDKDSLLTTMAQEALSEGLALCMVNGRIGVYRPGDFAGAEGTLWTVGASDMVKGAPPRVMDTVDNLVSSVVYKSEDGRVTLRYVDQTYLDEWGEGASVSLPLPRFYGPVRGVDGAERPMAPADMNEGLEPGARLLLEQLGQPQRVITVTLPLPFLGMQTGDLVLLTHPQVPTWSGTRGLTSAVCQVQAVRRTLFGGRARVVAELRLSASEGLCGYAPEALVAGGGLALGSPVVTLDAASWGTSGFAPVTTQGGVAVTDGGASWFRAGDKVRLSEIDNETPAADETFTVVSVDPSVPSVTLDANPTAGMVGIAAAALKVVLRYQGWDNVVTAQEPFGFIADATPTLGAGADDCKRYS